ncbi:MAG: tetratricopeptide repeat protein [Planctomycetia bacterium]|nr:tetratricopeptide repeat protein [Planctomycetia bacterium]
MDEDRNSNDAGNLKSQVPIDQLGLKSALTRKLKQAGIKTLGQLASEIGDERAFEKKVGGLGKENRRSIRRVVAAYSAPAPAAPAGVSPSGPVPAPTSGQPLPPIVAAPPATQGIPAAPYQPALWEKICAYSGAGIILVLAGFLLVRNEPITDANLVVTLRTLMSVCAAVLGAAIPGFLHISLSGKGQALRAGGALALFVLTYWATPKVLPLKIEAQLDSIKQDTESIKADTKGTRRDVAEIAALLRKELSPGGAEEADLTTEIDLRKMLRKRPSRRAKELASEIPNDANAYALALKAIAEDRLADARTYLGLAQEKRETELANIYLAQGDVDYYAQRPAESLVWYKKALHLQPDDVTIMVALAMTHLALTQYQEATHLVQRATKIVQSDSKEDYRRLVVLTDVMGTIALKERKYKEAETHYRQAESLLRKHGDVKGRLMAGVLFHLGYLNLELQKRDVGLKLIGEAIEIDKETLPKDSEEWSRYLDFFVTEYQSAGKLGKAQELAEMSLDLMKKKYGPDDLRTTATMNNLAEVYAEQGKTGKAEELHKQALSIRERQLGPIHPLVAVSYQNLGSVYGKQKKYAEAEAALKHSIGIWEKAEPADALYAAFAYEKLGEFYFNQDKNPEAVDCAEKQLQILTSQLGKSHKETERCTVHLIGLLLKCGSKQAKDENFRAAERTFKRAIGIAESLPESHRLMIAQGLDLLAFSYAQEHKFRDAEAACKRAYEIHVKALGPAHELTGEAARHWSLALRFVAGEERAAGNARECQALFEKSVSVLEEAKQEKHAEYGKALDCLATEYFLQTKLDAAESLYKKSLKVFEETVGPNHKFVAITLGRYAQFLRKTGKVEQANAAEKRVESILMSLKE